MEIGYLNEVKAILKSLVLSHPNQITIDKLNRDYRDVEGQDIPFRRLGYRNLEQFLRQIPDTLLVAGSGHSALVYFVGNEKSAHIHNMIMGQKKSRPRPKSRARYRNSNAYAAPHPPGSVDRGRHNSSLAGARPPPQIPGQRLSAFGITNRNVSTRTVTVRDVPQQNKQQSNSNVRDFPPSHNNISTFNALPLPSGIKWDYPQNAHRMNVTTAVNKSPINQNQSQCLKSTEEKKSSPEVVKKFQEHVKQLEGLLSTSCNVTTPALKTVSFSPETKTIVHIPTPMPCVSTNALVGINPPKPKVKLSEDVERLLTEPPRFVKKINPLDAHLGATVAITTVVSKQVEDRKDDNVDVNKFKRLFDISDADPAVNDIDEAVPEFAANHRVFRLDFPKYTVPYGRRIERYKIPDNVHVGSHIGIFIAEIHNPFRFWFHIHKDEHELDTLMHQMERFYATMDSQELRIPIACLNPRQVCAASFNGMWHRGEIVTTPVNNKVKVSFIDYGTVSEVDLSEIKYLGSCFSQLPTQALRGCLSHIKPRGLHWSHDATSYFLSSVSELMLYAKITEIDRENLTFYMILCDTHGDEVIQINKNLVDKNYALFNEDWQELKILKNNDRRVRHPREDFPTFSMIESGEYPSYADLVYLQQHNIDYEIIYDRIIFNKYAILNTHDSAPESIRKLPFFLLNTNPFRSDIMQELTGVKTSNC